MSNAKKKLANLIRNYRCKAGMSQLFLSYSTGYTTNCIISRVETGDYTPSPEIAFKLGKVLQIPDEDLFNGLIEIAAENIREKMKSVQIQ